MPDKHYSDSSGIEFALIPPGEFLMGWFNGRPNERPPHEVTISKPFYLGKYPVTKEQWATIMGEEQTRKKKESKNVPVGSISHNNVMEFLDRINKKEKSKTTYRLPTEAEWEYACRSGTTTEYIFGSDAETLDAYAWYKKNSRGISHRVGFFRPNRWGLHDMTGNVWEWVADWYQHQYKIKSPIVDPQGLDSAKFRVLRGGSFKSSRACCRISYRQRAYPSDKQEDYGFRLVAMLPY